MWDTVTRLGSSRDESPHVILECARELQPEIEQPQLNGPHGRYHNS